MIITGFKENKILSFQTLFCRAAKTMLLKRKKKLYPSTEIPHTAHPRTQRNAYIHKTESQILNRTKEKEEKDTREVGDKKKSKI